MIIIYWMKRLSERIKKIRITEKMASSNSDNQQQHVESPLTVEQIFTQQMKIQEQQKDIQLLEYKSNRVIAYLDTTAAFTGDSTDLLRFITAIEHITPTLVELPDLDATLRFQQILTKLQGKAKLIANKQLTSWSEVKVELVRSFTDPRSLGELQDQIEKLHFANNIQSTYNAVSKALTRVMDKISLGTENDAIKEERKRYAGERAYRHFRSIIPESCKASLNGHKCNDVDEAIRILAAEGLLNERFNQYQPPPTQHNSGKNNRRFNNNNNSNNSYNKSQNDGQSNSPNNNNNNDRNQDNNHQQQQQFDRNSGNSRRSFNSRQNKFSQQQSGHRGYGKTRGDGNYPDSGMNRVHEPMEVEQANFHLQASRNRDRNYLSSESKEPNA